MKIELKVGQVWQDCDPRSGGRTVRILGLTDAHAYAIGLQSQRHVSIKRGALRHPPGSERRTGFRLVSEASVEDQ